MKAIEFFGKDDPEVIIPVEIERPNKATRMFKNMDAALDFCKFVRPPSLSIETTLSGVVVHYTDSSGRM